EGRPFGHEVRVGNQHARRVPMRSETTDRFAGGHEQRFVVFEIHQLATDDVEGLPRARGFAISAIDDEIRRALGDLWIEIVLSMRKAASCTHPLQESVVPRGARTVLDWDMGWGLSSAGPKLPSLKTWPRSC